MQNRNFHQWTFEPHYVNMNDIKNMFKFNGSELNEITHLVVLTVQQEVQRDEVIIVGGWTQVEDEAMDAVFDKRPKEHTEHEKKWKGVLVDQNGVI